MKTFLNKIKNPLKILIISGLVIIGTQYALAAWSEPSCNNPNNCNADAPINVSGTEQTKGGTLNITGALRAGGVRSYTDGIFDGALQSNYLYVTPQNGAGEGGELQLQGSGGGAGFQIDNYQGNARIHTLQSGKIFQVIGGDVCTTINGGICLSQAGTGGLWAANGNNIYNTNSGNVGVGTNDPSMGGVVGSKFTINTSGGTGLAVGLNGEPRFALNPTNEGWTMYDRHVSNGGWSPGISQRNGNVGIQTSNPIRQLHVNGEFSLTRSDNVGFINVSDTNGNGGGRLILRGLTNNGTAGAEAQVEVHGALGIGGYPAAKLDVGTTGEVRFPSSQSPAQTHFNYHVNGWNYIRGKTVMADTQPVGPDSGTVSIGIDDSEGHKFKIYGNDPVAAFQSNGSNAYIRLYTNQGIAERIELANRGSGKAAIWVPGAGDALTIRKDGDIDILNWKTIRTPDGLHIQAGYAPHTSNGVLHLQPWQGEVQIGAGGGPGKIHAKTYFYFSDKNLKENIKPLQSSLSKILQLKGVAFDWKKGEKSQVGLIAQDVEKIYPELVVTDEKTGLKSVEYGNLVAPLIEAVKEQQKQIDTLKKEVEILKNKK
jgi:hypothetical protein